METLNWCDSFDNQFLNLIENKFNDYSLFNLFVMKTDNEKKSLTESNNDSINLRAKLRSRLE